MNHGSMQRMNTVTAASSIGVTESGSTSCCCLSSARVLCCFFNLTMVKRFKGQTTSIGTINKMRLDMWRLSELTHCVDGVVLHSINVFHVNPKTRSSVQKITTPAIMNFF